MCVLQIKHLMIMKWTIKLKRVYEPAEADDGLRILVDRVWPRGIKKSDLRFDIWAKDVTPSSEARQFFHADPSGNWDRFSEMYREELRGSDALRKLADQIRGSGFSTVTLLYGFRNPVRNHASFSKRNCRRCCSHYLFDSISLSRGKRYFQFPRRQDEKGIMC